MTPDHVLEAARALASRGAAVPASAVRHVLDRLAHAEAEVERRRRRLTGAEFDVFAERAEQRAKWGDDHDDAEHADEALAAAAAFLAWPDGWEDESCPGDADRCLIPHPAWAYTLLERHGADRRRQLVIAAALLIAEIERLDRR